MVNDCELVDIIRCHTDDGEETFYVGAGHHDAATFRANLVICLIQDASMDPEAAARLATKFEPAHEWFFLDYEHEDFDVFYEPAPAHADGAHRYTTFRPDCEAD